MRKKEIIKHFRRMPNFERKEKFMRENKIKFSRDRFHNVTVWADDGTLLETSRELLKQQKGN